MASWNTLEGKQIMTEASFFGWTIPLTIPWYELKCARCCLLITDDVLSNDVFVTLFSKAGGALFHLRSWETCLVFTRHASRGQALWPTRLNIKSFRIQYISPDCSSDRERDCVLQESGFYFLTNEVMARDCYRCSFYSASGIFLIPWEIVPELRCSLGPG